MCSETAPGLNLAFVRYGGPDGRIVSYGTMLGSSKHGTWRHFDDHGGWSENTWAKGILHGPTRRYDVGGRLRVAGQHANNLADGPWHEYASDGRLLAVVHWLNGRIRKVERHAWE